MAALGQEWLSGSTQFAEGLFVPDMYCTCLKNSQNSISRETLALTSQFFYSYFSLLKAQRRRGGKKAAGIQGEAPLAHPPVEDIGF